MFSTPGQLCQSLPPTIYLSFLLSQGDQLHGVVPKKIIWKFEPLLHEGVAYSLSKLNLAAEKKKLRPARNDKRAFFEWNTEVQALDSTAVKIPRHKFSFTAFEELESCAANTYLTDVVGVLTSLTTLQEIKRANGQRSIMRDINLQNLSGVNVKITLWGDATSELSRNLDQHGIEPAPVMVVVIGCYVKKYLGKLSLSSTNSTKVYFNMELPEVVDMRQRQLLVAKWDAGCNEQNKILCRVTANRLLTDGDWYYPGCSNCTTKLVGEEGDWWCTKCEAKIDEPIPRFMLRFEVQDRTNSTIFVALDSEVQKIVKTPASEVLMMGEVQKHNLH
ncbi:hypothetical protein MKW98_008511 [Papaver atlanticum]|uniref:Uncharacterized protein n=1 Tax=Papaver atlanticum TaxID=357466 RepID=A0AAD4XSA9_9MAGN|nr:hypothetical protein MKW98_008511 [Papaver atlanticum]